MSKNATVALVMLLCNTLCLPPRVFAHHSQYRDYTSVIQRTAGITGDRKATELARKHGLQILNLTWEDTGRYKNSSVGPNISDMTIQIQQQDPDTGTYTLTCMPVIRHPNFSDRTGDISLDKFYLLVGNERGKTLHRITLREYLGNFRRYLHNPYSWKGRRTSLLAPRDTHVLVSAQACFLPIPPEGIAEFNPVLFNYQSYNNDPAVLTILVTREGTSATIIDNNRDAFQAGNTWGQRLFFNQNGERASLTGERISDFQTNVTTPAGIDTDEEGLNMVLLIQVPLKQKKLMRFKEDLCNAPALMCMEKSACGSAALDSDVENAVIGHGKIEGPFTEIADLAVERDPAFPIRVTVQFYKATGNGIVSSSDMRQISEQIEKVYTHADYVGSLVTGGDTHRPTEYIGDKNQPRDWWKKFRECYENNTGDYRRNYVSTPRWGIISDDTAD
ncbi:MAG: hypothetical protein PHO30_03650 [Candidatus Omnitrophica bacterium]|nr:hypothetical protein [Candidatus Omnitrophota bacterium]